MQLMLYIGNDLIEAVPINTQDLSIPGYLGKFKRMLKMKYRELLMSAHEPVEFLVVNPEPQKKEQPSEAKRKTA